MQIYWKTYCSLSVGDMERIFSLRYSASLGKLWTRGILEDRPSPVMFCLRQSETLAEKLSARGRRGNQGPAKNIISPIEISVNVALRLAVVENL